MTQLVAAASMAELATAVNEFLATAAAHLGTSVVRENGYYYAFVDYTPAESDESEPAESEPAESEGE